MEHAEFDGLFDKLIADCRAEALRKRADYASEADALHNFKEVAAQTGNTAMAVWGVYFWKHVSAVLAYVRKGRTESEPIRGRIIDAINYLGLLAGLIEEKERGGGRVLFRATGQHRIGGCAICGVAHSAMLSGSVVLDEDGKSAGAEAYSVRHQRPSCSNYPTDNRG